MDVNIFQLLVQWHYRQCLRSTYKHTTDDKYWCHNQSLELVLQWGFTDRLLTPVLQNIIAASLCYKMREEMGNLQTSFSSKLIRKFYDFTTFDNSLRVLFVKFAGSMLLYQGYTAKMFHTSLPSMWLLMQREDE